LPEVLEAAWQGGRLGHALLLSADDLLAVECTGLALAARLLQTQDPRSHPDYHELRPQKRARLITIGLESERVGGRWPANSMRGFRESLMLSAYGAGPKVGVLFEADRLRQAAANAFLKLLEEPPRQTTLILLTTRPGDLLPTLRSRCMRVRLARVGPSSGNEADWAAWLEEFRQWLVSLVDLTASRAQGSARITDAYGLLARYETLSHARSEALWKAAKTTLPEGLDEDALSAHEVGIRKAQRARQFADIEAAMLTVTHTDPQQLGLRLARATAVLEDCYRLMEVFNDSELNAVEHFLLKSLRIWTGR
jgi:DNA polymerase-3 subunit delta'